VADRTTGPLPRVEDGVIPVNASIEKRREVDCLPAGRTGEKRRRRGGQQVGRYPHEPWLCTSKFAESSDLWSTICLVGNGTASIRSLVDVWNPLLGGNGPTKKMPLTTNRFGRCARCSRPNCFGPFVTDCFDPMPNVRGYRTAAIYPEESV
jgi:hypothetical protein